LPTPVIRLFSERVHVARSEGLRVDHDETTFALLELSFDYEGTRVRSNDERASIFRHGVGGLAVVARAHAAEREACRVLEQMGAVDLSCLDDVGLPPGCDADYAIRPSQGQSALCAFSTDAVPKLRRAGFVVEIARDYPFQVVAHDPTWVASIEPDPAPKDGKDGWFNLELGIEIDGRSVDLLPFIVDMLDDASEDDDLRALERRAQSFALRLSDTEHVTIPPARLRALLRVVVELYMGVRRSSGRIAFPSARTPALAALDDAFTKNGARIRWKDPAGALAKGRAIARRTKEAETPAGLRAELRPYQVEGVAFLQHLAEHGLGGILADDMGLGKTLQTIAFLAAEKQSGRATNPSLVIAPTSLAFNWAREIEKFAPHLRVVGIHGAKRGALYERIPSSDVVVTTYPILIRDEEKLGKHAFHALVLDEAQAIKNTRTQAFKSLASIRAEHRICLTGTPVENHLGELWALMRFLDPELLGDELTFRRIYRAPIEIEGDEDRLDALREQVAPYILRRTKREVAKDLPPKTELLRPVELRGKQRELYEHIRVAAHGDVRKVIRTKGLAASTITILDALMKLRQVCCDPRLVAMDAARNVRESAKTETFFDMMDTLLPAGHRVLVFSQFTSMLALLAEGLRKRDIDYLTLTGQTRDRRAVVDGFERGDADVFLISLKAGGTGLNLVSADTVIHFDPWWNPAAQAQATDRAYRIGQTKPTFVHSMYAAGSVEERVIQLQKKKRWLSTTLLGDQERERGISELEIDHLFAPLDS
jgi:superfamily II DNA or RNA helicase